MVNPHTYTYTVQFINHDFLLLLLDFGLTINELLIVVVAASASCFNRKPQNVLINNSFFFFLLKYSPYTHRDVYILCNHLGALVFFFYIFILIEI